MTLITQGAVDIASQFVKQLRNSFRMGAVIEFAAYLEEGVVFFADMRNIAALLLEIFCGISFIGLYHSKKHSEGSGSVGIAMTLYRKVDCLLSQMHCVLSHMVTGVVHWLMRWGFEATAVRSPLGIHGMSMLLSMILLY